jgi:hypothetical protein
MLRPGSFILFLLFFAILPFTLFVNLFSEIWMVLFLGMVLLLIIILTAYYFTHKKIFSERKGERWQNMFVMLLSPPLAVRAAHILSRDLFSLTHPLQAARYLFKRDRYIAFSSELIRNMIYSGKQFLTDTEEEIVTWYNGLQLKIITELLKKDAINLEMILTPPARESDDIAGYCPKCHAQYRAQAKDCADCNIALKKY